MSAISSGKLLRVMREIKAQKDEMVDVNGQHEQP